MTTEVDVETTKTKVETFENVYGDPDRFQEECGFFPTEFDQLLEDVNDILESITVMMRVNVNTAQCENCHV